MKAITIEEHFIMRWYADYLEATIGKENTVPGTSSSDREEIRELLSMFSKPALEPGTATYMSKLLDAGEGRLRDMDEAGIGIQVLSLVPGVGFLDSSNAVIMSKRINDELCNIIRGNPKRFAGLATLAPQEPDKAADELERAVSELGLRGAILFSHVKGEYLDNKKYWPIFKMAEKLGVPIYIHPRPPSPDIAGGYFTYPELSGPMWGYGAEVGLHAMRLICSGVFDEYPKLNIILGHMGEALPYWLRRIDGGWKSSPLSRKLKKPPSGYVKDNFFITTSGMFWLPALMCAYLALGADRILFAVDYPFQSNTEAMRFIDSIPVSDGDKEKICHLNAENLFGI